MMHKQPASIYLHIPFCQHRCAYCDFNTYSGLEDLIPAYVDALHAEIRWVGSHSDGKLPVHTIFFGGGTPSLLSAGQIQVLLQALRDEFSWSEPIEVTLEANPGTLSLDYLRDLFRLGVNRLSLGMQSAVDQDLQVLERNHSTADVIQGVEWARRAGFENISLDLIFGIPDQSLDSWMNSLSLALSFNPEHLSLYSLTVEHGTPMANWVNRGLVSVADPDLAADMYEVASERLAYQGYNHYEISNWARKIDEAQDWACRHNLQYWRTLPYLGLGAGAHGCVAGVRTVTTLSPGGYITRMKTSGVEFPFPRTPATVSVARSSREDEIGEYMMMGLRLLREGISLQDFKHRFGIHLVEKFGPIINRLSAQGLLENRDNKLRLTPKGYLLGNRVFREFI